eukprot:SAG31_NODE_4854_length_2904_cov_1.684492_2_plen_95_part_00
MRPVSQSAVRHSAPGIRAIGSSGRPVAGFFVKFEFGWENHMHSPRRQSAAFASVPPFRLGGSVRWPWALQVPHRAASATAARKAARSAIAWGQR